MIYFARYTLFFVVGIIFLNCNLFAAPGSIISEFGKLTAPHARSGGACLRRIPETAISSEQHNNLLFADQASETVSDRTTPKKQSHQPKSAVLEDELDSRIILARKLIKRKDYLGASALLETVYTLHHDNTVIYNLLQQCYKELQYFTKWEELARRMVIKHSGNYRYQLYLAQAFIKQEKLSESLKAYRQAASMAQTGPQCREVIENMVISGFETEAMMIIDSLSVQIPGSAAIHILRGTILEKQKLYRKAAEEFCSALDDTTSEKIIAEKKLLALLGFEESSKATENALRAKVETEIDLKTLNLLTNHYLKTGRFDHAFEYAVKKDSIEGFHGKSLMPLIRSCRERKLYSETARICEYILDHAGNSVVIGEVYFTYADVLTKLGRSEEAIVIYDSIVAALPLVQEQAVALYGIGNIYLNHLYDYPTAIKYFDSVVTYYRRGSGYIKSHLAIPFCFLHQGNLDEAARRFKYLSAQSLNEDIIEQIRFNMAMIQFCQRQYDSSEVAFHRLMIDYPRGFYFNDVIQLMLVMNRVKDGPKDMLHAYSDAKLFEWRRMPDSTISRFRDLADDKNGKLADVALYYLSQMSLDRADSIASLEYIDRLVTEFPDSYYLPFGLKIKADIYLWKPDRAEEAGDIYRQLLKDFSNYPFASEIRKKLRELEIDRKIG